MCYYFDNTIKDRDIYYVGILLDEKSYEKYEYILVYNISSKLQLV